MDFWKLLKQKKNISPDNALSVLGTDIHSHLIPGIDDGSQDIQTSIDCIREMKKLGYKKICLTPHFQSHRFQNDEDDVLRRADNLREELQKNNIDIELLVGGEYRIDSNFKERISKNRFLTIYDKYLLIEFSFNQAIFGVDEIIFELQKLGYDIILAHPERYIYFQHHPEALASLKEYGVYFQENINSFAGFYGHEIQKLAFQYVQNNWVEFLGTDIHNKTYLKALKNVCTNKKFLQLLDNYDFQNNTI